MRRILWLVLLVSASSCGEEERQCIVSYDRCPGANPCDPICVFEDEVPTCTDLGECASPNEEPGSCELFANECEWR